jgi:hypothetical protein
LALDILSGALERCAIALLRTSRRSLPMLPPVKSYRACAILDGFTL